MHCSPRDGYTGFVPRRVLETFTNDLRTLESASECSPGVVLLVQLEQVNVAQISLLNRVYLDPIITICRKYGGDIIELSVDKIVVLWQWEDTAAHTELRLAAFSAQSILSLYTETQKSKYDGIKLKTTISLSLTSNQNTFFSILGGLNGRWRYLLSGEAMRQVHAAMKYSKPSTLVISSETWELMKEFCFGTKISDDGYVKFDSFTRGFTSPQDIITPNAEKTKGIETLLASQIPPQLNSLTSDVQMQLWMSLDRSGTRTTSVLKVNIPSVQLTWENENSVQKIFKVFQKAVLHYEGYEFENTSDESGINFTAVFGCPPMTYEEHSTRALLAAIEIQKLLYGSRVGVRAGITTGEVYHGVVGSKYRKCFTFFGEPLTVAHHAAMKCAVGGILCTEKTVNNYNTSSHFRYSKRLQFKKTALSVDELNLYEPTLVVGQQSSLMGIESKPRCKLNAREEAVSSLVAKLKDLTSHSGGVIFIEGDSGMGKTYLVDQVIERASDMPLKILRGSCLAYEKNTPFFPVRSVFMQLFESQILLKGNGRSSSDIAEQMKEFPQFEPYLSLLNYMFPSQVPMKECMKAVNADNQMKMLGTMLRNILQEAHKRHPIVLVLEDVHWMDEMTLHCIQQCIKNSSQTFLLTSRSSTSTSNKYLQELQQMSSLYLQLEALDVHTSSALFCSSLGVKNVPKQLETLLDDVGGNPRYIMDLANKMKVDGHLEELNSHCYMNVSFHNALLNFSEFYETTGECIVTQYDSFPPSMQIVLEIATIQEIFDKDSLCAFHAPLKQHHVGKMLRELESRGIIQPVPNQQPTEKKLKKFRFKNKLWRKTVYSMISPSRRAALHAQAVKRWEDMNDMNDSSQDPDYRQLAVHYSNACVLNPELYRSLAINYLEKAAELEERAYHIAEAQHHLTTLLSLAEDQQKECGNFHGNSMKTKRIEKVQMAAWERRLAVCYGARGNYSYAVKHLERALEYLGQSVPDSKVKSALQLLYAAGNRAIGKVANWKKFEGGDRGLLESIRVYQELAEAYYFNDELPKATYTAIHAASMASQLGRISRELAICEANLSVIANIWTWTSLAHRYIESSMKITEQLHDPETTATVYSRISSGLLANGKWSQAIHYASNCNKIATSLNNTNLMQLSFVHLGFSEMMLGHHQQSIDYWLRDMSLATDTAKMIAKASIAMNHVFKNEVKEAVGVLGEADGVISEPDFTVVLTLNWSCRALCKLLLKDIDSARSIATRTLDKILKRTSYSSLAVHMYENITRVFLELAQIERNGGKNSNDAMMTSAKTALNAFKAFVKSYPCGKVPFLLQCGRLYRVEGNVDKAIATFRSALKVLNENYEALPFYKDVLWKELVALGYHCEDNSNGNGATVQ